MKKIMAFILVASLACTMATTAFAAQNDTDPVAPDLTTGEVLTNSATIKATTKGNGQVTSCDFDSEPKFSDETNIQNLAVNAERGTTIKLSAKADTGWKFSHWEYSETGEMFSLSRTIPVDVEDDKNLTAVFVEDSMEDSDTSGEASEDEANAESSTIAPGANIPKTGDSTSALALPALLLSSLAAAVFIAVRNRKHDRD